MADFIAYYRVSTDRQGASGLGLDAQRQAVAGFIGTGQLVAEFTEIESGRRHTNRPQLLAALAECRKRRAVLLIARLDRLARNVAFSGSSPQKSSRISSIIQYFSQLHGSSIVSMWPLKIPQPVLTYTAYADTINV